MTTSQFQKKFDGQCAGQQNQMLLIWKYIHKKIKIPHINIYITLFLVRYQNCYSRDASCVL